MSDSDRATVLVVDDDSNLLDLYDIMLSAEYDLRTAGDGEEALESLDASVDVILLDRRMPNLSGDEALREIRKQGYDCPVAMVTAVEPDVDILDLGFDDYLVKPFNKEDLQELLDSLLRRTAYDDAVREHFSLASKVATLESTHPLSDLQRSEEYTELRERLESSREEARTTLESMEPSELNALFRDIDVEHPSPAEPRD